MQTIPGIDPKRTLSGTRPRTGFVTFPTPWRSTFPLSLFKSIHHLNCDQTVAQAKGEVFKFVDELSSWVVHIEANFEDGRGKFSSRARKNLVHIRYLFLFLFRCPPVAESSNRNLVNEILKWGWARLV
jgi:hypothetical protein